MQLSHYRLESRYLALQVFVLHFAVLDMLLVLSLNLVDLLQMLFYQLGLLLFDQLELVAAVLKGVSLNSTLFGEVIDLLNQNVVVVGVVIVTVL